MKMKKYKFIKRTRHTFMAGDTLCEDDVKDYWLAEGRLELVPDVKPAVDIVKEPEPEKKVDDVKPKHDAGVLDINKDGKVDMKDVKKAGTVLRKVGARLKKGKKK